MASPVDLLAKEDMPTPPAVSGGPPRWRTWALAALVVLGGGHAAHKVKTKHAPGCAFYRPVATDRMLIAHAAGGLPDRMYPNSIEALDRSYARGLRVFEMDFWQLPFGIIRAGHDPSDVIDPREAWLSQVLDWMRRHPDARLLPDMKTDNVAGLKRIAQLAPDLKQRITPFVYTETEYEAVRALGFSRPIYALFHQEDADWLAFANSHDFAAVALSEQRIAAIPQVRRPVIVYTFDVMQKAPGARGVITNCMVPAAR